MPQPPERAKSTQPNIPAISNAIGTKVEAQRDVRFLDEAQVEVRQLQKPADLNHTTANLKGRSCDTS